MKRNENNSYAAQLKNKNKPASKSVINKKNQKNKASNNVYKDTNGSKENNSVEDSNIDKKKPKQTNNSVSKNGKTDKIQNDTTTYYGENTYYNLLKKERDKLTQYLNDNSENVKLIGNERYKHIPLNKYLYDNKRHLPENKMGLIPIPLKSNKRKSNFGELYKIQRGLVSLRRMQYEKNRKKKDTKKNFMENVIFIQAWWRKVLFKKRIIKIQRCFKLFRNLKKRRKQKKLEQMLKRITLLIYNKFLNNLRGIGLIIKPKTNKDEYISKSSFILSFNIRSKIIMIQKNYRRLKAVQLKNKLLYGFKYKLNNQKLFFFTKKIYNNKELIEKQKINFLQKNIKLFSQKKSPNKINHNIQKIKKEVNGNYIEKIYINNTALYLLLFVNKLEKIFRLISFKKIKESKQIYENCLNSIIKIQKLYKLHYKKNLFDSQSIIKINSNKKNYPAFISIKRIRKNLKDILLIQKAMKSTFEKIQKEKDIIRNKPRSFDFEHTNQINKSKRLDSLKNNNNHNYKMISYITKNIIINEIKKVIMLQKTIKKYIHLKKAKEEYYNQKNISIIQKNNINKIFIITKKQKRNKENIDKIKTIQNIYKKRFKYLKDNIVNDKSLNSNLLKKSNFKIKNKQNNKNNNSIISLKSININGHENYQKKRRKTLMSSLIKRNKKPIFTDGFFCDKIRINPIIYEKFQYIKSKIYILLNKTDRGIYISKKRIKNNNDKIELIQKEIKKRKKEKLDKENILVIKKPKTEIYKLTNNKHNSKLKKERTNYSDLIGEKIYTIYNKRNLFRMGHINMNNYYFLSKEIRINNKTDLNTEREYESIKNEIKRRNINSNNNEDSNILFSNISSEIINTNERQKEINTIHLDLTKNKQKNENLNYLMVEEEMNIEFDKDALTFRELNSKEEPKIKTINKNCYLEKIRFKDESVFNEVRKYLQNKIYKKHKNFKCFISKINIKYVKVIKKMDDSNEMNLNDENNEVKNSNKIGNKTSRNEQEKIKKAIGKGASMNYVYPEMISNGNKIFDLKITTSIDKTRKKNQNIDINSKVNYFHNKMNYIYFFQLFKLFTTKNTQEYLFYKIKETTKNTKNKYNKILLEKINQYNNNYDFDFPFYIKALLKLYFFCKNDDILNEKINKFFKQIFPYLDKNKSFFYHLIYLSPQNKKKLINTNLYNLPKDKEDLIEFLDSFSYFDNNISNKKFFEFEINNSTFNNTNIFTLIKFVNKNTDKILIYKEKEKSISYLDKFNKKINNYVESKDRISDFDISDTENSRKTQINYFMYENKDIKHNSKMKNNQAIYIKKKHE